MPATTVTTTQAPLPFNEIDLARGASLWTELDRTLYNQLPIYLAQTQAKHIQIFDRWTKVLKPIKWTPNQGNTMRGVRKERSPVLRGQALPNTMISLPTKDVIAVRELFEDAQLYRKDFDSNVFQFQPSFADFLSNHVDATNEDMVEKMMVYKDLFYRTAIFHGSPAVWVCGKGTELTLADHWISPNIQLSKTAASLQALIAQCDQTLTLENIKKLGTVMFNDIAATPFSGGLLPEGSDGKGNAMKYVLVCGSEVWDGFTDTGSYLLTNKALDLDIVTGPFTGSLFGRWTALFERFEMRIAADGTVPAPESTESDTGAYNYGDPVMNPAYVNAPFGVAFAVGAEAYKAITVGPPPSLFARGAGGMTMDRFNGMDWNGKVQMTRNILVPTLDAGGNVVNDTNRRGEYLMLMSDIALGILPIRRRNIVPIIYARQRIATS
jgi:hypothetical protein